MIDQRFQPHTCSPRLRIIARKFVAERQWGRILQVGAPDLDDIGPGMDLFEQQRLQPFERRHQPAARGKGGGNVQSGRKAVVGRLALVDMIVGMDRRFAAARAGHRFVGDSRDHLVDVHVGLGARSGLPDDQREMIVIVARGHRGGGRLDRIRQVGVEAMRAIHPRGRLLHDGERVDDADRHPLALPEREILDRALRLSAPISVGGNFDRAEAVGFDAGAHGA